MKVTIEIAPYIRPFAGRKESVEVNGTTVRDCLTDLVTQFPGLKEWLFDRHGTLKTLIVMNRKTITRKDLDTKIGDCDRIRIIMPLGGG